MKLVKFSITAECFTMLGGNVEAFARAWQQRTVSLVQMLN